MTIDLKQIRAEALIAAEEAEHNERKFHSCQTHSGTIRMPARVVVEMCDRLIEADSVETIVPKWLKPAKVRGEVMIWESKDVDIQPSTCGAPITKANLGALVGNPGKKFWRSPADDLGLLPDLVGPPDVLPGRILSRVDEWTGTTWMCKYETREDDGTRRKWEKHGDGPWKNVSASRNGR